MVSAQEKDPTVAGFCCHRLQAPAGRIAKYIFTTSITITPTDNSFGPFLPIA